MGSNQEYDPIRRRLICQYIPRALITTGVILNRATQVAVGEILAAIVSSACQPPQREGSETTRKWERREKPDSGDIIRVQDNYFLLRNGKRYPIPDVDKYKQYTKFEQYGRRLFSSGESFGEYPLGEVPQYPAIIDQFTGNIKTNKPLGGEINIYFAGFLTAEGKSYDSVRPGDETFKQIIDGLSSQGWHRALDNLFFTYGERATEIKEGILAEYSAKDTASPPEENIKYALEFLKVLKKQFPLVQFNLIGHSLGGVFAMAVAMEYYDAINNVILINSPVKGLRKSIWYNMAVEIVRQYLPPSLRNEQVTDYLFKRWDDEAWQRELDQFGSFFTSIGRQILTISDQSDLIVPSESTVVKGATQILLQSAKVDETLAPFPVVLLEKLLNGLATHGRLLKDKVIITRITKQVGENLVKESS